MVYRWLADAIVAFHVAYVLFILVGLAAVLVGGLLGWRWIHNRWFRGVHFLLISIVAFEAIIGMDCPLTTWENHLRELGGQTISSASFMGRLLHALIFFNLPSWAFNVMHVGFALLVLAAFWLVPVHWRPTHRPPNLAGGHS